MKLSEERGRLLGGVRMFLSSEYTKAS